MVHTTLHLQRFGIFAILALSSALLSNGRGSWVGTCHSKNPWKQNLPLRNLARQPRSFWRNGAPLKAVVKLFGQYHAKDGLRTKGPHFLRASVRGGREIAFNRTTRAFVCASGAVSRRPRFFFPSRVVSSTVWSTPEVSQTDYIASVNPSVVAAGDRGEPVSASLPTQAFREARRKAVAEGAERFSRNKRMGLVSLELPGDDILSRNYPSFEAPSQYLPPTGVDNLPTDPLAAGASAAAEISIDVSRRNLEAAKLHPLADPRAPVGALGQGGRLWDVLGMDDEKVSQEVAKEVEFVKERWMQRLKAVHEHVRTWQEDQREGQLKKIRRLKPPKWIIPIRAKPVDAPGPLDYDFTTYGPQLAKMVAITQSQVSTSSVYYEPSDKSYLEVPVSSDIPVSALKDVARENVTEGRVYGPAISGFRLKQVTPPFVHQRGIAAIFYFHAPHSTIYPPFINACRRESFDLPRPAVTAIKIENADSFVDAPSPHASTLAMLALQRKLKEQQLMHQIADTKRRLENMGGSLDAGDVDTKDGDRREQREFFRLQQQLDIFERQLKYVQKLSVKKASEVLPASAYLNRLPVPIVTNVIGMREDSEDLIENLRMIIFRRKPESRIREMLDRYSKKENEAEGGAGARKGTFENPWVASLSVKGPIAVVAGDLQLPPDLEIVNKSQYLCTMSANYYLNFQIKIEEINEFVLPEYGVDSLNRDIDSEGFYYFTSYVAPVPSFGFNAQRVPETLSSYAQAERHQRAAREFSVSSFESLQKRRFNRDPATDLFRTRYQHVVPWKHSSTDDLSNGAMPSAPVQHVGSKEATEEHAHSQFPFESLGEVVTIEIQTNGSATPRQALLECLDRFESLAKRVASAVVENCKIARDGTVDEVFKDSDLNKDKHRFIGVPRNPYKGSIARAMDRHSTFFRKDFLRQYSPVTEQLMARREMLGVRRARPNSKRQSETVVAPDISGLLHTDVSNSTFDSDVSRIKPSSRRTVSEDEMQERLLDEEELEEELVERSPTIRLEREREYQATVQLFKDLKEGDKIKARGDGLGTLPFHTKFRGLEEPPDWVFENFMANRIPVGLLGGIQDD